MECNRCHKDINHPDDTNADYVISDDAIVVDEVEGLIALKETPDTKAKKLIDSSVEFEDSEYDEEEIDSIEESENIPDLHRVKVVKRMKPVQKTFIVCPDCYLPTDFVIWGVHKVPE